MGKRKFIKPDDSDSEYEWEEAAPKKPKSPVIHKDENELSSFLNCYTSNSNKDNRKIAKQQEKEAEEKRLKDRMIVQTEVESQKVDSNWLRRVYKRAEEQSRATGEDMLSILRERYDEKTIHQMGKLCGSFTPRHQKASSSNYRKHEEYDIREERERSNEKETDVAKNVEERYVTDADLNEASAALLKAELSGSLHKVSKLKKRVEILREAQKRNLKIRLTRTRKEEPQEKSVMIEKMLKSGKLVPYVETGSKFRNGTSLVREEDATDERDADWMFAQAAGRTTQGNSRYEEAVDREYAEEGPQKSRSKPEHKQKQAAISAQKRRTAAVATCQRCYSGLKKHLVLAKTEYFALSVPTCTGLTIGHWRVTPLRHVAALSRLDEDEDHELSTLKAQLRLCYEKAFGGAEAVFLETAECLHGDGHAQLECVPVRDVDRPLAGVVRAAVAQETEAGWGGRRRLLEVGKGTVRGAVPPQVPYVALETGKGAKIATVAMVAAQDARTIPAEWGLDLLASLVGLDLIQARDRKDRPIRDQAAVAMAAEKIWAPFDQWRRAGTADTDSE